MVFRKEKNRIGVVLFILIYPFINWAQWDFGLGINIARPNQMIKPIDNPALNQTSAFGIGGMLLIQRNFKNNPSSIRFGLEYSSLNHNIIFDTYLFFMTTSSIKIPLQYGFKFNEKRRIQPLVFLGLNTQIQFGGSAGAWSTSMDYEIKRDMNGGFFPMLQLNLGANLNLKNKNYWQLLFGMNKGFIQIEEYIFKFNPNQVDETTIRYDNFGNYFDIKIVYFLKGSLKNDRDSY